jgi:hypothetical protein
MEGHPSEPDDQTGGQAGLTENAVVTVNILACSDTVPVLPLHQRGVALIGVTAEVPNFKEQTEVG